MRFATLDDTLCAVFGTFALWYNALTAQAPQPKDGVLVSDWQAAYADKHFEETYRRIPDYESICNVQQKMNFIDEIEKQ